MSLPINVQGRIMSFENEQFFPIVPTIGYFRKFVSMALCRTSTIGMFSTWKCRAVVFRKADVVYVAGVKQS